MTIEKALRVIADLAEKKVIENYAIAGAVAAAALKTDAPIELVPQDGIEPPTP